MVKRHKKKSLKPLAHGSTNHDNQRSFISVFSDREKHINCLKLIVNHRILWK